MAPPGGMVVKPLRSARAPVSGVIICTDHAPPPLSWRGLSVCLRTALLPILLILFNIETAHRLFCDPRRNDCREVEVVRHFPVRVESVLVVVNLVEKDLVPLWRAGYVEPLAARLQVQRQTRILAYF